MVQSVLRILLALALWASPAVAQLLPQGPPGLAYCTQTFQVTQGAVALTKIISNVPGKTIYVCGWDFDNQSAAQTIQFEYGTGTNCGSGTTALTQVFTVPANSFYVDHIPYASMAVPQGNDVCLVTTGTSTTAIILFYGQF